jgi:hypothetical protein
LSDLPVGFVFEDVVTFAQVGEVVVAGLAVIRPVSGVVDLAPSGVPGAAEEPSGDVPDL